MKLKSNFSLGLNFKPQITWPDTVPALSLSSQLLCGFDLNSDHPVFEHAHTSFETSLKLLKSIYPQLTLPELARLVHSSAFNQFFQIESLLKTYQFHANPELIEIMAMLVQTTREFQDMVSAKKVGAQELTPLLDLNSDQRNFIATEILNANESKQESVKRLELLSDLLLMKHSDDTLSGLKLSELVQKRFPVTTSRDQALGSSQLPWLSQIKTQFKRQGDKAGFEVKFFAGTPAELVKLAQNLTRVAQEWNSKP